MLARSEEAGRAARSRIQVGDWWVDPAANELGRNGQSIRIEPKAMQVLAMLAAQAGRVVARDDLLAKVWPGVVVGDEVLTQTIIKLRKALGDNPRSPSYIETISKRGYRLIAPVRAADGFDAAPPPGAPPPAPQSSRTRPRFTLPLVLVAVAATAAAGYALHALWKPAAGPREIEQAEAKQAAPLTVTVMPFESLSADEEQAYLAQGITNDLTTDLSRLPELRVITASSGTIPQGASPARYLVLGSVQRESGTLRVNIRLVDTRTNQQLWSQRFERPFRDLFAVQDQIVQTLTEQLPAKLGDAAKQRLAKRYTRNLEAYDYFLRAQSLFLVRQEAVNEEARSLYRKAIELDPEFARAYAGLAMTYAMDNRLRPPGESSVASARAFELAESARLIDPDIPEVYWALAFVHVQSNQLSQGIESLRKAIELNPSYADAYAFMGGIYTYLGESEKTIPLLRTALRLNPDGGYLYFLILGRAYFFENDPEQALINLREASARNPADLETRIYLAAARLAAGDRAAAEWEALEIRSLAPGFSAETWLRTYPMADQGYRRKLAALLAQVGL